MNNKHILWLSVLGVVVLLQGCSTGPSRQEMSSAIVTMQQISETIEKTNYCSPDSLGSEENWEALGMKDPSNGFWFYYFSCWEISAEYKPTHRDSLEWVELAEIKEGKVIHMRAQPRHDKDYSCSCNVVDKETGKKVKIENIKRKDTDKICGKNNGKICIVAIVSEPVEIPVKQCISKYKGIPYNFHDGSGLDIHPGQKKAACLLPLPNQKN